jgi:hypothetical protein
VRASIFSILTGALFTFVPARVYYQKAGKDSLKETSEIRRLNNLILRAMAEAGLCESTTDNYGHIRGLKSSLSGKIETTSFMTAKPTVTSSVANKI